MKKVLALVAMCGLGALVALPAAADDHHRGRRDDRYERRYDDRGGHRPAVREERSVRGYQRRDDDRHVRYVPRAVVGGRYCDDYRHYRGAHYHVATQDYYRYDYPREAYWLQRGSGIDATLVVTLPLF